MEQKLLNEHISHMRKMMGINEFFSMPGEREGLPAPTEDMPTVAEDDNEKYAKTIQGIHKYGSRPYAIKLVDAFLTKIAYMTASDLSDTARYAKGLDAIESLLSKAKYEMAYRKAKETATGMLKDEGFGKMFETENSEEAQLCSECGTGYMHEGSCSECGYIKEESMDETEDLYGINTIANKGGTMKQDFVNSLVGDKSKDVKNNELKFFIDKLKQKHPNGVTPEEAVAKAREFEYINTDKLGTENRADFIILMTQLANANLLINKKTGKKITPQEMSGYVDNTRKVANQANHSMSVNEIRKIIKNKKK